MKRADRLAGVAVSFVTFDPVDRITASVRENCPVGEAGDSLHLR